MAMIVALICVWPLMGGRNQERGQQSAELWRLRVKAVWAKGADLSVGLQR